MKKIALTIMVASGLTSAAFAQGTVNWVGVAGYVVGQTNGTVYSTLEGGTGAATGTGSIGNTAGFATQAYYYELLVSTTASTAPSTAASLSSWSDTGLEAEDGASANGRLTLLNSLANATALNWASGVTESVVLVGWSANLGTSWSTVETELTNWSADQIANAYFGTSVVGSLAAQSGNPGVTVFGTGTGQIDNPSTSPLVMSELTTVPEPGTLALAALGGASLLMFRRKQK